MRNLLLVLSVFFLVACTSTKKPMPITDRATFDVRIVETIPSHPKSDAITTCLYATDDRGNVVEITECTIYIKSSVYPKCLAHEIRHVFEGEWHPINATIKGNLHREDC